MRVRVVVLLVLITGSLAWVGTQALSGNLVYYVTPTEGVVLEGRYGTDGAFHSDNMLVKHGEQYRPPAPGETPAPDEVS